MSFSAKWTGGGLEKFEKAVKVLGSKKTKELYRSVINAQGALLRKDAVRILPEQSGLQKKTIQTALGKPVKASQNRLTYKLSAKGGFVRLKYFDARETKTGVFARPRNEPIFLPRHFTMSGLFPNRKPLFNGHVFKPKSWKPIGTSSWGRTIQAAQRSDVRIPDELTSSAMESSADKRRKALDREVLAGIKKLSGGIID